MTKKHKATIMVSFQSDEDGCNGLRMKEAMKTRTGSTERKGTRIERSENEDEDLKSRAERCEPTDKRSVAYN